MRAISLTQLSFISTLFAALFISFSVPVEADTNADIKSAWQNYLDGKHKQAAKQLMGLAKKDNARAQNYLGSLYAIGHGVKPNHKRAAQWYERAAKQGFAPAQFNIGFLLLYGAGDGKHQVYANPKAAARWLKKAAHQNETDAQYLLCQLYHQGRGVSRDYDKALTLCRKAALNGLAGAQFELGILFIRSLDTKKFPEAYRWFLQAAKQRFPCARHNVRLLAERLKPEEKKQAQTTVQNWRPGKP